MTKAVHFSGCLDLQHELVRQMALGSGNVANEEDSHFVKQIGKE